MIINNTYIRRAEQRREYATDSEQNKHFLTIAISHRNGQFIAVWTHEIDEAKTNYTSTLTIPTADCNGKITIKDARFSIKYLEKADKLLADNLHKYFDIWNDGQYQELANTLYNDFNNL